MKDFYNAKVKRVGSATGAVGLPLANILAEFGPRVVSVKEFGAVGNGSTNDYQAIMDAADYLLGLGGGTLYFPGAISTSTNYYKINSTLDFTACPNSASHRRINLVGDGAVESHQGSWIRGVLNGAPIIKQGNGENNTIRSITGLGISNEGAAGIGIEYNGAQTGEISHCYVTASGIGILSRNEAGGLCISNCFITGSGCYGVGVQIHQGEVTHCPIVGWAIGVSMFNGGCKVSHCRLEVNLCGIMVGTVVIGMGRATSSGTTLTVAETYWGSMHPNEAYLTGSAFFPIGWAVGNYFSNTSGTGPYTTEQPTYFNNETVVMMSLVGMTGYVIDSCTFERGEVGINNLRGAGGSINGCMVSAVFGPSREGVTFAWTSAGGGTATATVAGGHKWGTSGTRRVSIAGASPSGYNVNHVLATITGATTFTYPVANPGGTSSVGNYSADPQYGIRCRSVPGCSFNGISISDCFEQAALDLAHDYNNNYGGVAFNGTAIVNSASGYGETIRAPQAEALAEFTTGTIQYSLLWANRPGGGACSRGAVAGLEYTFTNARDAGGAVPDFGEAATQGGGSTPIKLFYNGSAWTRSA